ncbi:type II toxin-antitoxin system RelE/ParE family toxin [bacterium]|nr:MAG: type II toxin-antitoxin system RelE/ParE family toxin [bacterium]
MTYRIEFTRAARKTLLDLGTADQRRIARVIDALASNPRPRGHQKLEGGGSMLRIRVGSYRVIYDIDDDTLLVLVLKIGHRREVYRT